MSTIEQRPTGIRPGKESTITLSPTRRPGFPNGASTDVARVLRAHGYQFDSLVLLDGLRDAVRISAGVQDKASMNGGRSA